MAVLISTKVRGQTAEGYDGILDNVRASMKNATGFIMHFAHPSEQDWTIYELWQSKKQADEWFGATIVPNLPKGLRAKRTYQELHSLVATI